MVFASVNFLLGHHINSVNRGMPVMTLDSIREFAEYILDDAAFKVSFVQGAQWSHAL